MPEFKEFHERYGSQGFQLVAVNVDTDTRRAESFLGSIDPTFPVLLDSDAAVMGRFGVSSMPTTFLVGRDGIVRHKVVGYRETDLPDTEQRIRALLDQ